MFANLGPPHDAPPPADHCAIYCSFMRLPVRTTKVAIELVLKMSTNGWDTGFSHHAIAAACIAGSSVVMYSILGLSGSPKYCCYIAQARIPVTGSSDSASGSLFVTN